MRVGVRRYASFLVRIAFDALIFYDGFYQNELGQLAFHGTATCSYTENGGKFYTMPNFKYFVFVSLFSSLWLQSCVEDHARTYRIFLFLVTSCSP